MRTQQAVEPLTKRRPYFFWFVYTASVFTIIVLSAEIGLRIVGEHPWTIEEVDIVVEPGGKFFTKHPTLGYTHLPGEFEVVMSGSYSFKVTHLDNTLRATQPQVISGSKTSKEGIWLFGGSFTHGWSLSDEDTFPWLAQSALPAYKIVNFGVLGYGTLQSLIQFEEALQKLKTPQFAIIIYASFHDERNTFLRSRRKNVAPYNKLGPLLQPYAKIDGDGHLTYSMAEVEYREWPLMRYSAFSHSLERLYNRLEEKLYDSHGVSRAIVKEFSRLATENGIKLIIAGITSDSDTSDMLAYAASEGILTTDISVDLSIKGNRNLPYDGHPSAVSHRQYARRLVEFLRGIM